MTSTPQPALNLYFVAHNTASDLDFDLLIWASDPEAALAEWRRYFGTDMEAQIFPVPTANPKRGALPWHDPEGLQAVEVQQ